jgi:two-component system chemotaxis response regulator CheY
MSKKILVVDDSKAIRQSLIFTLKGEGYDVIEAANGVDALNIMKDNTIGLFISDVNMPEMDGIELLKQIKQDKDHKYTPVIMLTTESGRDMIEAGKEAGAKAWMIKPFQPEEILSAVKKLFVA